jgi:hypothetical protein
MTTVRNRKGAAIGQAIRDAIRTLWDGQPRRAKRYTAPELIERLPAELRRSANDIRHHMRIIDAEAPTDAA